MYEPPARWRLAPRRRRVRRVRGRPGNAAGHTGVAVALRASRSSSCPAGNRYALPSFYQLHAVALAGRTPPGCSTTGTRRVTCRGNGDPGLTKPTSGGAPRGRRPTAASGGRVAMAATRHGGRRCVSHSSAQRTFALVTALLVAALVTLVAGCGGIVPRPARTRAAAAARPSGADRVPTSATRFSRSWTRDPHACSIPIRRTVATPSRRDPWSRPAIRPIPVASSRSPLSGSGTIALPSDQLLVADYFTMHSYFLPDMARVQLHGFTGRAPVCAHLARFQPPDQRIAFLHVRLLDEPVERWIIGTAGLASTAGRAASGRRRRCGP